MREDPDIILKKLNLMITGNLEDSLKKCQKIKNNKKYTKSRLCTKLVLIYFFVYCIKL